MVVEPELTTAEAAEIAGVTDRTIRNWIKDELLPAKNTPGGRLVRKDDVLRVLREKGYTLPLEPPIELFPKTSAEAREASNSPPTSEAEETAATPEETELQTLHGIDQIASLLIPYVEQLNWERERSDELRRENRDLAARVGYLQGKLEESQHRLLAATTVTMVAAGSTATPEAAPWWKRLLGVS